MFRKTIAAGLFAIGALAATAPANAAGLSVVIDSSYATVGIERVDHRGGYALSPREVRRILRYEGYRQIQFLDRGGRVYTARAEDYRGRDVIVRVSARSGNIISVRRLGGGGGGHGGGHGDGHGGGWEGHGGWR